MDNQKQFLEQRKLVEEYCFTNRIKNAGFKMFLEQSEQLKIPIKDWDLDMISKVLNRRNTIQSFTNAKKILLSFCKFAGYDEVVKLLPKARFVSTIRYFPSFLTMRNEIKKNIKNTYDLRCYDNIRITALLLAIGLSVRDISEAKKSDYQDGVLKANGKTFYLPKDFENLMKAYYNTDSYVVCNNNKRIIQTYHESDSLIKNTNSSITTLKMIRGYCGKIPLICNGRGLQEIKVSRAMWEIFRVYGYDLENPNVLADTDWALVRDKGKIPCKNFTRTELKGFYETLIAYRKIEK